MYIYTRNEVQSYSHSETMLYQLLSVWLINFKVDMNYGDILHFRPSLMLL